MDADTLPDPTDARAVRRTIHAFPELGFCEIRTANLAWRTLESLGWVLTGGTSLVDVDGYAGLPGESELETACAEARAQGVDHQSIDRFGGGATAFIAELSGNRPGPTVALRVDMDALPVAESRHPDHRPAAEGFASRNAGRMHACGHDGHVAIGLRVAAGLSADRDFPGRVRLILQPAEEGVRGAAPMVAAGVCDDVDTMLALHLGFGASLGSVAPATDLYATTKLRAEFIGKASHASNAPEEGRNALLAAASAILSLHGLPPFASTPTRVNVGTLLSEGAPNIIPARAILHAEVRAGIAAVHEELERRALAVLSGAAAMQGVEVRTSQTGRATTATNDRVVLAVIEEVSETVDLIVGAPQPLRASDDATLMMNRVQDLGGHAAYILIGSGDFGAHHSPTFDIDESALEHGAHLIEAVVRAGCPEGVA